MAGRRPKQRATKRSEEVDDPVIDWFFMRPCVGLNDVSGGVICPPLCKWSDLIDGTYSIADVMRFNITMDELSASRQAMID